MLNEIIEGISMQLYSIFGEGYEIYQNDIAQGLQEPCFLITILQPEVIPMLGKRCIWRNPFDIQYFPRNPQDNVEMLSVVEQMVTALDFITLRDGNILHATSIRYEIVDRILHFFVNYNLPIRKTEVHTYMETLRTDMGTTRKVR